MKRELLIGIAGGFGAAMFLWLIVELIARKTEADVTGRTRIAGL